MRFSKPGVIALLAALAFPLGCDWPSGSTMSFSQTVGTWLTIDDDECLLVGTYRFEVDADFLPFDAKASIKMKTQEKDDMEFLPEFVDLNYRLDGNLYYQQRFELSNGKGKFSGYQPNFWSFDAGDELEWEICADGGEIPIFTDISVKFNYKFADVVPN